MQTPHPDAAKSIQTNLDTMVSHVQRNWMSLKTRKPVYNYRALTLRQHNGIQPSLTVLFSLFSLCLLQIEMSDVSTLNVSLHAFFSFLWRHTAAFLTKHVPLNAVCIQLGLTTSS